MAIRTPVACWAAAAAAFAALLIAPAPFSPSAAQGRDVVVFAAASLKNALDEIATAWTRESGGKKATISYAASSALAKQIAQAAPATSLPRRTWTGWPTRRARVSSGLKRG